MLTFIPPLSLVAGGFKQPGCPRVSVRPPFYTFYDCWMKDILTNRSQFTVRPTHYQVHMTLTVKSLVQGSRSGSHRNLLNSIKAFQPKRRLQKYFPQSGHEPTRFSRSWIQKSRSRKMFSGEGVPIDGSPWTAILFFRITPILGRG